MVWKNIWADYFFNVGSGEKTLREHLQRICMTIVAKAGLI